MFAGQHHTYYYESLLCSKKKKKLCCVGQAIPPATTQVWKTVSISPTNHLLTTADKAIHHSQQLRPYEGEE